MGLSIQMAVKEFCRRCRLVVRESMRGENSCYNQQGFIRNEVNYESFYRNPLNYSQTWHAR